MRARIPSSSRVSGRGRQATGGGARPAGGLNPEQRHRRERGSGHQQLAPDQQKRERQGAADREEPGADAKGRAFGAERGRRRRRCHRVLLLVPPVGHQDLAPWLGHRLRGERRGGGAVPPPGVVEAAVVLDDELDEGGGEAGLDGERTRAGRLRAHGCEEASQAAAGGRALQRAAWHHRLLPTPASIGLRGRGILRRLVAAGRG
ncbi:hypothetical protein BS78_05G231800 [Paspalum vaginatum]|nr:hypothetical protein BS78_05G231800 [Paspalum vaginatum]